MTSTLENLAFNRLRTQFPDLQRKGFETAVRAALDGEMDEDERIGFIPDGWFRLQCRQCKPSLRTNETGFDVFVAIEIEDGNALSPEKLWRYCELYDVLDFYDIGLILVVFDRYGYNQRQLDLARLYIDLMMERHRPKAVRR